MKKLISILAFIFILNNNVYSDEPRIWYKDENTIHIAHKTHVWEWHDDIKRIAARHCKSHDKYFFWVHTTSSRSGINKFYKKKRKEYKGSWVIEVFCSDRQMTYAPPESFSPGTKIWHNNFNQFALKKDLEKKKIKEQPKENKPKPSPEDNKVVAAASGSGFFVSNNGDIITNHHVIDQCKIVKVNFKGNAIQAKILAVDKVNDIAILKANIKPNKIYSVSNEDVSLLEDVVVAGYPLGKKVSSAIKTHKGVVTSLAGAGDNYSNFQTDATINQGNSGGPIINQKGNIVGIAVATWIEEGVQGVHFGIKSSTLKTFASANGLKFLPPNNRDLSNKELGKLITEGTVYVECHMTIAKIKKMIAEANNRKAFFSDYQ